MDGCLLFGREIEINEERKLPSTPLHPLVKSEEGVRSE